MGARLDMDAKVATTVFLLPVGAGFGGKRIVGPDRIGAPCRGATIPVEILDVDQAVVLPAFDRKLGGKHVLADLDLALPGRSCLVRIGGAPSAGPKSASGGSPAALRTGSSSVLVPVVTESVTFAGEGQTIGQ